jgi:hypothetical protein
MFVERRPVDALAVPDQFPFGALAIPTVFQAREPRDGYRNRSSVAQLNRALPLKQRRAVLSEARGSIVRQAQRGRSPALTGYGGWLR